MAKKDDELTIKIRKMVRDTLAIDPDITLRSMQELFQRRNYNVSHEYLRVVRKKVQKQIYVESDHVTIQQRVSELREQYKSLIEQLKKQAYYVFDPADPTPPPTYAERTKAIAEIVKTQKLLLDIEMNAGIYTRQLGVVGHIHKHTVEEKKEEMEELGTITQALENWGIVPKLADIPVEEPKQIEAVVVEPVQEIKENATNTTTA